MSNMNVEFPSSFELWEFVSSFDEGSLPASAWDERALAVVALWYLSFLPPAEAARRVVMGLRRNRIRFDGGSVSLGDDLTVDDVWPCVVGQILTAFGKNDPVAIANQLMKPKVAEIRHRAA